MIKLLRFLIHGCFHEWEIIDEITKYHGVFESKVSTKYTLKCKKCGTMKTFLAN